jgi:hypothetical protein
MQWAAEREEISNQAIVCTRQLKADKKINLWQKSSQGLELVSQVKKNITMSLPVY